MSENMQLISTANCLSGWTSSTTTGGINMFRKLKELYQEYKEYVRVDLIMYGVMILLIILYFIYTVAF